MSPLSDRLSGVTRRLGSIRGAIRRRFAIDGLSRLTLAAVGFVVATFALDWFLRLPSGVRLFLLVVGGGALLWILIRRLFYPLAVKISDDDLALMVERQNPQLNDRLISAIQLARNPGDVPQGDVAKHTAAYNSPELVEALVNDAQSATEKLDFKSIVIWKHVGKYLAWAGVAAGILILGAVRFPVYADAYFNRIVGGDGKYPQLTHLKVLGFEEGHRVVARGKDLGIAVTYEGKRPSKVTLYYTFETGEKGRERMTPQAEGNRFLFTFMRLSGPFKFRIEGGDDRTNPFTVSTVNPPSISGIRLFYEYPKYMSKPPTPPEAPETSGNIAVPLQTKVRFEAESNEDLEAATLVLGLQGKEVTTQLPLGGNPRLVKGEFLVTEVASAYELKLDAKNGLSNDDPIRFTVRGMEDQKPQIVVHDPQSDEYVTELCERPLEIEVRDDHGVSKIAVEHRVVAQKADKSKDWSARAYTREQNSRDYGEPLIRSKDVLNIGAMGLQKGDHVELRFRAEDYKDIGPKNFRLSKVYKLSIVSVSELEKELQDAIEKIKILLRSQKNRQDAAWNRSTRLMEQFGRQELLPPDQQAEIRQAGLEQNDITSKLEGARKDIRHIQRRGVYNKVYNESAAAKLQAAIDELDLLLGKPGQEVSGAVSREAAALIDQSAKVRTGEQRTDFLRTAQRLQSTVSVGIQRALEHLDKWSSYQEVIRITRELKDHQGVVNEKIKKAGQKKK